MARLLAPVAAVLVVLGGALGAPALAYADTTTAPAASAASATPGSAPGAGTSSPCALPSCLPAGPSAPAGEPSSAPAGPSASPTAVAPTPARTSAPPRVPTRVAPTTAPQRDTLPTALASEAPVPTSDAGDGGWTPPAGLVAGGTSGASAADGEPADAHASPVAAEQDSGGGWSVGDWAALFIGGGAALGALGGLGLYLTRAPR